jgi:FlgD Ig-like domain
VAPTATATPAPGAAPISGVIPYPNPSTGETVRIQFVLATGSSDVKLRIFTTAFRKVKTQDLGSFPAGVQTILITLTDDHGRALANGVYYVEISDSQGRAIGKLMILR